MAVYIRFVAMHRLVRACTSSQTHTRHRDILVKLSKSRRAIRTFSTASVKRNENKGDNSDSTPLSTKLPSKQALLHRSRRHLSPLERISNLLPQEVLSPEVMQLREQNQQEPDEHANIQVTVTNGTKEEIVHEAHVDRDSPETPACVVADEPSTPSHHQEKRQPPPTVPGERLLAFGEMVLAEHRKKRVEFRKMFKLKEGERLHSSWGFIQHNDIAGKPAGHFLKTNKAASIFVRRASLEEFVLYMRRAPAIAYPKDASAMLMMMDVTEGDCVLESGSGSGAMTLFLSRAVGSKGSVLSVEVRADHLKRAVLNYNRWRTSWRVRRGEEWPDNVQFHNADICAAPSLLAGRGFHAAALDMINPHLALPTVIPHLHLGAVCAVYLANITQVVDLLEGLRCSSLPVLCERIIEVPVRNWLVVPALQKDGQYCTKKAPVLDEEPRQGDETSDDTDGESTTEEDADLAFGSVPYVARPHSEQMSHTAFLVKLRKCVK
ncbi:tRNA (adenine(58)-N(1))-methyltransferase, mitochondrial isoform X2 [Mugil cephalus]|uniref:tRNA (adenine(58)-N(1))-methyltransferase, mitochondrial isoform X2 n=1 Tax=Mugil cephalus TaxID=48193 RepID=UPI001FB687CF|nr:tRNA (adenine(58)-N(1))-methyltransferase, mitochondrial isoform X2 [Mugil cephalus]